MNPTWQSFLEAGPRVTPAQGAGIGTDGTLAVTFVCDLSRFVLVGVTGKDAQTFLQGQLTNDIESLDSGAIQRNAYCNPKGRVITVLHAHREHDGFLLQLPDSIAEPVLRRLRMYVLRSDVVLEPPPDLVSFGIGGANAAQTLTTAFRQPPGAPGAVASDGRITVIHHGAESLPRYQVIGPADALMELWDSLAVTAEPVRDDLWWRLDIRAGLPQIGAATSELFTPQMLNLDLIGGLSFTKGCYPGQEIVARTRYLGKLKQRMFLAHAAGSAPPAATSAIVNANTGAKAGQVVVSQADGQDGADMLAVLRLEERQSPLAVDNGASIELLDLPYSIDNADQRQV